MGLMIQGLNSLLGLAGFICFILVVIQMFKHDEQTIGIICAVTFCCVGPLIAFVYGWMNSGKWGIQNIMFIWTGLWVAQIILVIIGMATGAFGPTEVQFEQNFDPNF